jgi:septum formation protein
MQITSIILASKSKFRQKLLQDCGLHAEVAESGIAEAEIVGESPAATALLRAAAKARAVAINNPHAIVIGADQTLALEGRAFSKASSVAEATANLVELSGRTHHLYSAVSIAFPMTNQVGISTDEFVVTVPMTMRILTQDEINAYVNLGEWQGCVGSYQAENAGANLFTSIGGDITAIMGLPMSELLTRLRALGINPLLNPRGPWFLNSQD